jgi:ring-1,2-phenylacetyl-CoA epoxidase subunit PaaE
LIEVIQPLGSFGLGNIPEPTIDKHIVLWGCGSGITPLISIVKYALNQNICAHITLVYGNKKAETSIFFEEIKLLQQTYLEKFSTWHFFSDSCNDNVSPYINMGRIDPEKVLNIIKHESSLNNTFHYICGPLKMKEIVRDTLNSFNIPEEKIFTEDFEVTRDPKAFEEIYTQTVSLIVNGGKISFEVPRGKSILESGLDQGLELAYSCQIGDCLLCKAKLLNGNIKLIGMTKQSDELLPDERLLCCSFPLTNNVELSVENFN